MMPRLRDGNSLSDAFEQARREQILRRSYPARTTRAPSVEFPHLIAGIDSARANLEGAKELKMTRSKKGRRGSCCSPVWVSAWLPAPMAASPMTPYPYDGYYNDGFVFDGGDFDDRHDFRSHHRHRHHARSDHGDFRHSHFIHDVSGMHRTVGSFHHGGINGSLGLIGGRGSGFGGGHR
jgi:hypothetical protein